MQLSWHAEWTPVNLLCISRSSNDLRTCLQTFHWLISNLSCAQGVERALWHISDIYIYTLSCYLRWAMHVRLWLSLVDPMPSDRWGRWHLSTSVSTSSAWWLQKWQCFKSEHDCSLTFLTASHFKGIYPNLLTCKLLSVNQVIENASLMIRIDLLVFSWHAHDRHKFLCKASVCLCIGNGPFMMSGIQLMISRFQNDILTYAYAHLADLDAAGEWGREMSNYFSQKSDASPHINLFCECS